MGILGTADFGFRAQARSALHVVVPRVNFCSSQLTPDDFLTSGIMNMKSAIVCLGLLALVGSSTASLDAFNSVKEFQELEHTGGQLKSLFNAI
jgi:hypothetical protein